MCALPFLSAPADTCRMFYTPAQQGGEGRGGGAACQTSPASPAERPTQPRQRLDLLRRELSERWPQTLARFRSEFERVAGVFHRVASASDVPAELEQICHERAARRLIAWPAEELGGGIAPALS